MDLRRLRHGEWLMAAMGVALLVVLVLHGDVGVAVVLLAILAVAAIGAAPLVARSSTASPGVAYETLVLLGSIVGMVVALIAALWGPLVVVVALAASCLVAMRDERLSTPDRLTDSTGVPVDSAPQPERLSAPPA